MKKLINLIVFILIASLNGWAQEAAEVIRVACVGNSITFGSGIANRDRDSYPSVLGQMLGRGYEVRNFGFSARTMLMKGDHPYMKEQMFQDALKYNPDIVVIKLGTNDSKSFNWKYKADLPKDIQTMVSAFKAIPSKPKIYLWYPPKAYQVQYSINDSIIEHGVIPVIDQVAKRNKLPVIDLHTALSGMKEHFPDNVHPDPVGAQKIAETEYKAINGQETSHRMQSIPGFNNEMTGRENIYMNGTILGMTRAEVDAKLDQIIEFSECGDFIDTPVKRYSSGMFVKLAFAVAAHLDSEIMVMDEVLAVGDMKFQQKCLGKMSDVAGQEGRTVLYVSHNMSTIRQLCTRCIVLNQGKVIYDGNVEDAIAIYMDTTDVNVTHYDLRDSGRLTQNSGVRFFLEELNFPGKESSVFRTTEPVRVELKWHVSEPFSGVNLKFNLHFRDSSPVGITHPVDLGPCEPGRTYTTTVTFDPAILGEGQYHFFVDVFEKTLASSVCLDKPNQEFAFEAVNTDLTIPEWSAGWGRIHIPPHTIESRQES